MGEWTFASTFDSFTDGGLSGEIVAKPVEMGNTSSHEFGHGLGLLHYSTSSGQGTTYLPNAIMATPDLGLNRETWASGTNTAGAGQDDMAVISRPANTIGYRADDHGSDPASATPFPAMS